MKKIIAIINLLVIYKSVYADINIKTQIKEVTIYTSGAQVKSKAEANLIKGSYNLIFENVSQFIDENSIQLKGNSDFTILSITVNKDFLNEGFKDSNLKKLEDSLAILNKKMSLLNSVLSALNEELTMLRSNQKIGGNNATLSSLELDKMSVFYRTRVEEIHNKQFDLSVQMPKIQEKINAIQNQIDTYNSENSKNLADIIVAIKSNVIGNVNFDIAYYVGNVGWTPFYDIRAENTSSPVVVNAKANVWQNTGENWKDVKLFISTGNPTMSNNLPILAPYYLSVYPEYRKRKLENKNIRVDSAPMAAPAAQTTEKYYGAAALALDVEESNSTVAWTNNIESTTNNLFDIAIPYSIKSDGKINAVDIQRYEIPAKFSYISRPKKEAAAFLEARITDWNQSGLLPGEASVYFEGSYIGKTQFETNIASDTMSITFGRDNNIMAQRKRVKFLNDKSIVANTKSVELGYEITLKNIKKTEIEIVIEDQLPLSPNTNSTIEELELSKAEYDKETGKLKWVTTLKAGESKVYKFGFRVKYPKGNNINTDF